MAKTSTTTVPPAAAKADAQSAAAANTASAPTGNSDHTIKWNDEALRSSYANVVNVVGGREEISLLFGQSRNWKPEETEVIVDLNHKMVLSPLSAKRLAFLLANTVRAYEQAYGALDIGFKESAPKA